MGLLLDLVWCFATKSHIGRCLHSFVQGFSLGEVVLNFAFKSDREAELLVVFICQVVQIINLNTFQILIWHLTSLPSFLLNFTEPLSKIIFLKNPVIALSQFALEQALEAH